MTDMYALNPGQTYVLRFPNWAAMDFVGNYMRNVQPSLDKINVDFIPLIDGMELVPINMEEAK